MKRLFKKIANWFKPRIKAITPGKNAINGASYGLWTATAILWTLFAIISVINIKDFWLILLFLGFTALAILLGFGGAWIIRLAYSIPRIPKLALIMTFPLLIIITADEILVVAGSILIAALAGASILVFRNTGFNNLTRPKKVVYIVGTVVALAGIVSFTIAYLPAGFDTDKFVNAATKDASSVRQIDTTSPGEPGPYSVNTITYGSGKDKHRSEFGQEAGFITDSINGIAFIDNWKGISGWWRTKYWGFDFRALPLNARVWYPDGEGPFPLALIVHGNHSMQDYSDPGYDYLGELLASRGIILASVDENFINGSWSDLFGSLDEENDARGWLLLEHLRQWHKWNRDPDHRFYAKVDTTRLALLGHSRGGECVAHAAMFNALPYYPDDASIKFDYNFNIRSIVAIAPVDGQYEPGDARTKFENVNYFVLHGAQDADVRSFMGSQQYERVSFTDSLYHFKSGLYIYGANHGQFNTTWGKNDTGHPFTRLLNLKQLLPAEDQQQIAKVYISAFLDATLNGKYEYLPLFADWRTGRDWLPETTYLNQFEDTNHNYLCTFDEDFDVTSTSQGEGNITSSNLTVWREAEIQLQWQKKGSRAVYLGWNYNDYLEELEKREDNLEDEDPGDANEEDYLEIDLPDSVLATYSIQMEPGEMDIDSLSVLIFSMAESTESSTPKTSGKWVSDDNAENKEGNEEEEENEVDEDENTSEGEKDNGDEDDDDEKEDEEKPIPPIDFSIQLTDSLGNSVKFPLHSYSYLQREISVVIWKMGFIADDKESEKVFQLFRFPIVDLLELNSDFQPGSIRKIQFIFDKSKEGVVVIDNIGFTTDFENNPFQ